MKSGEESRRPGFFAYLLLRILSALAAAFVFRRRFLRNELRGVRGPCVVIANHQCALDFVNLVGATNRRATFVISSSFYRSLPFRGILRRLRLIPKQQFQTEASDLKKMKAVVDSGGILVIYPAGLMCEDGLSTPIPSATCKFLKWLKADVYVARTFGTYFVMPKWAANLRPGRTWLDVYRLFRKEELEAASAEEIREKTNGALLFDAYREQETRRVRYRGNDDLRGLENVLCRCPACGGEFTVRTEGKHTLRCAECGFAETGDRLGFLRKTAGVGEEIRFVSDWSRTVGDSVRELLRRDPGYTLTARTAFRMINPAKHRFEDAGAGTVTLSREGFRLAGTIRGEETELRIPITGIPALPFTPGKSFEVQQGQTIYRCVLEDGRLAMKFIHLVKALYEMSRAPEA